MAYKTSEDRQWYRTNAITIINEIVAETGVQVTTRFCPVQNGYFWECKGISSDASYDDPYEALEAWIIFTMRLSYSRMDSTLF